MAERKTTSSSRSKAAQEKQEKNAGDRVLWSAILFALGVLILAFTLIRGESAWNSIHNIFLGMFGFSVFLVPIILIYVSVMIAMDKTHQAVEGKVIQCFMIIFLLSAFVQIVSSAALPEGNLFEDIIPTLYAEGKQLRGGGVFSVILAVPLLMLFKKTGATIIISLLIFVFIMIFANKTVIDLIKLIKRWFATANAARDEYVPVEDEDFVPPPGAKRTAAEKKASKAAVTAAKGVPNADVPEAVVKEKAKNFNVDIPMPKGKKGESSPVKKEDLPFEPDEPQKELTEEEKFAQTLPQHPVAAPPKVSENASKSAVEKIQNASGELDDIIKKAAAPKKAGTAAAVGAAVAGTAAANALNSSASPAPKKQGTPIKQSTLASNKIQTDDELDMPETLTAADIQHEIAEQAVETVTYTFPPIELLKSVDNDLNAAEAEAEMKTNADTLVDTL
ncbi:MAG: DNA translocase FtsK 4TM domain-containing protein, partial [Oscillospiraceae bacterium]|nr:DNA translocase FtsK 4TM domain-containing protein [Oscillospiraceae bacterium]